MRTTPLRIARIALPFILVCAATPSAGQQKPSVTPADYGKWENLGSATLSPDGSWIAYAITRVDGDVELRYRMTRDDTTRSVPHGRNAEFSDDSRWLAYSIGVSEKERQSLEKAKKPIRSKVGLVDLSTAEVVIVDDIAGFGFSGDGRHLAMRGYQPEGRKSKGVDVIVRDLESGRHTSFGNAADFQWQDEGALLALAIDAEGKLGNGVQLYDPASGVLRSLDADTATYTGLTWREESADLAVLKVRTDSAYDGPTHEILAWTDLDRSEPVTRTFDAERAEGFPGGTRIVDFRRLEWSDDGRTVFFGRQAWEKKVEEEATPAEGDSAKAENGESAGNVGEEDEKPGVEVWHAGDVEIIPEQKVRANIDRQRNYLTAWHVDGGRFIEVGNELTEDANVTEGAHIALATDRTPHETDRMFGPVFSDLYLVDVNTGERTRIKERVQYNYGLSPAAGYVLYLENDHYWVYDVAKKTHTNITQGIETSFVDVEDDHTVEQKPPFGFGAWTPDDRSVLLYDKYDVWEVDPDGSSAVRLSDGAADRVRHRVYRLDFDERVVDVSKPVYVALYAERTKKYGFGTIQRGQPAERLVFLDRNVSRLLKAEDADVYAYVVQGFDDSPDYFVGGPTLKEARQVSETNPFQDDYAWGRSELVDFTNHNGQELQSALFYPASYEPGRKYPMIVYIYEITSTTLHNYQAPSERNAYNPTVWTQEGYFVLRPDIVYRERNPGLSAVEAIVPAVETVLKTGMIDETKVGLIGHSWGGYQTAFVPTQTNLFAAAVAGAPLTELYSMYLSVYWNSGSTDARIFEISQGRMEVPPWEDLDSYLANSPVHHIEKLNTPMLVTFGDKDGAVDWHQGIVMYNAARRAGKNLVMLVYEGENHGLAKKPNQIDYHRRVMEWFDHYLKGEPAPPWIQQGVRFLDKDKEKRAVTAAGRVSN